MKKALAILSVLALVGAVAFAEDAAPALALSGTVETGIHFLSSADVADTVQLYSDDAGVAGSRVDIAGAYTDGDFGLNFKLRSDGFAAPTVNYGYVWGNYFNKMVTVKAGLIDDSAWKTFGDKGWNVACDDNRGIQVQIMPVTGLNLGVKFNTSKTDATVAPKTFWGMMNFGATYTTDMFAVTGGYFMDYNYDADTTKNDSAVTASFKYTGMDKLTLNAEVAKTMLGAPELGITTADETIGYKITDAFDAGVLAYQIVPMTKVLVGTTKVKIDPALKTTLNFKPYANYKLNDIVTLNGSFFYELNTGFADKVNSMYVKPGVTLQVAPKAKIVGWYKYSINDISDEVGKTSQNDIQLDFVWNF